MLQKIFSCSVLVILLSTSSAFACDGKTCPPHMKHNKKTLKSEKAKKSDKAKKKVESETQAQSDFLKLESILLPINEYFLQTLWTYPIPAHLHKRALTV